MNRKKKIKIVKEGLLHIQISNSQIPYTSILEYVVAIMANYEKRSVYRPSTFIVFTTNHIFILQIFLVFTKLLIITQTIKPSYMPQNTSNKFL